MAKKTVVIGKDVVISTFDKMIRKGKEISKASATVGFTQNYALWVHENLTAHHNVGQARFLARAAEKSKDQVGKIVSTVFKKTANMNQSLVVGALLIQREAQLLTPIDTGALKASAFTSLTKDEDLKAKEAYTVSERIRKQALKAREKKK